MEIDVMKEEHIPRIAAIEAEAMDSPWSESMLRAELFNDAARFFVGTDGDELVCYGGYHIVLDEADVATLAVRADMRGKGYGRAMFENMLARAKSEGAKSVTLDVRDTNFAAIKLYESFGFKVVGVRKRYYSNGADAYVMRLSLAGDLDPK